VNQEDGREQLSEETISYLLFLFLLPLGLLIFFLKPLSLSIPGSPSFSTPTSLPLRTCTLIAVNQVICEPIYLGLLTGRLSLFLGRFLVRQGAFAEQIAYLFLRRLCLGYLDYKKQDDY